MERSNNSVRFFLTAYAVAVGFNYVWEFAQAPLYVGMDRLSVVWWHCLLASLGDGFLVLLILASVRLLLGRRWFMQPGFKGYALMLVAGFIIAVSVESIALHFGYWSYNSLMPLVPGLNIGIVPVLQMLVIPPLVLRITVGLNRYLPAGT